MQTADLNQLDDREFLAELRSSPMLRTLRRERRAQHLARRRELVPLLEQARRAPTGEKLMEQADAARARAEQLLADVKAAFDEVDRLQTAAFSERRQRELAIARLERELLEVADPAIDVFIDECQEQLYQLGRRRVDKRVHTLSGLRVATNWPSIQARTRELVAAILAAKELRFAGDVDVEAQLQKIRKQLGKERLRVVKVPPAEAA